MHRSTFIDFTEYSEMFQCERRRGRLRDRKTLKLWVLSTVAIHPDPCFLDKLDERIQKPHMRRRREMSVGQFHCERALMWFFVVCKHIMRSSSLSKRHGQDLEQLKCLSFASISRWLLSRSSLLSTLRQHRSYSLHRKSDFWSSPLTDVFQRCSLSSKITENG